MLRVIIPMILGAVIGWTLAAMMVVSSRESRRKLIREEEV